MSKSKRGDNGFDRNGSNDYEVGYKKPPEATRFKKGESGNPKGRPKKDKSIKKLLQRVLDTEMPYNENGERKKNTKRELIVLQLVNSALKGDAKARTEVLSLMRSFEPVSNVSESEAAELQCSPEEQRILDNFLARAAGQIEQDDSPSIESPNKGDDHG